jgi:hypothetical protein
LTGKIDLRKEESRPARAGYRILDSNESIWWAKRRAIGALGAVLIVIGGVFLWYGIGGLAVPPLCQTGHQCPSLFSGDYTQFWNDIYAGLVPAFTGMALVILSRSHRVNPNPNAHSK